MPRIQVETVQGPARREVIRGLMAFNNGVLGKSKYKSLTVTLRQGRDIVGGLTGWTWAGWLYVELLWIGEKYRGKGFGRSLMAEAEAEARKRGVENVFLSSFTFQAPKFYKKLGYREFGTLENYPLGHACVWLQKAL
jgi:ribosomal protein S18 acetylase RimI-like enzyme